MKLLQTICLLLNIISNLIFALSEPASVKKHNSILDLPDNFLLGAGTSAFQIEGALHQHGKSETWIEWLMNKVSPNVTADISSNSYHEYKQDVKVLNDIGLNVYRFSISWSRLLPTADVNNVNQAGVEYYNDLLDALTKIGVEPIVMLHHFDHPLILERSGGWLNYTTVKLFKEYAQLVFRKFGNRVKYFITFNEANLFCHALYTMDLDTIPTDITLMYEDPEKTARAYTCADNMLKAHAEVYHMYHKDFNSDGNGKISISIECEDFRPKNTNESFLADIAFEFGCGWIAHPIFSKSGDYPALMKHFALDNSKTEKSKLPTLSEEWINKIRGSADFFALSHYSAHLVELQPKTSDNTRFNFFLPGDSRLILNEDHGGVQASNKFYVVPFSLRNILRRIKREYNNPAIYVIENGYANVGGLNDTDRIDFLYNYIKETIDAKNKDNCDVRAYVYWSLIDCFEFHGGYTELFGLAHVDFNDTNRPRTLKQSALWLRDVIRTRTLFKNT